VFPLIAANEHLLPVLLVLPLHYLLQHHYNLLGSTSWWIHQILFHLLYLLLKVIVPSAFIVNGPFGAEVKVVLGQFRLRLEYI
jgi:hypothetical protein